MMLHFSSNPMHVRSGLPLAIVFCFSRALAALVPHPSDDEVRRQLREVLSRPELASNQNTDWLLLILNVLAEALNWLSDLRTMSPPLFWTLMASCIVLLALLTTHIVWTVRRVLFVSPGRRKHEDAEEKRGQLSGAYREEARHRAAAGDFTEAIRFLFLSLVYRFDESGRVLFRQSSTNREYLMLFKDRPQVYADLKVFVDTLDENWYGRHPTDQQKYENCLALAESLS